MGLSDLPAMEIWLIDWSIKASALFAAALCAERFFRRAQPELLLALHRAVLATLFAGPVVMLAAEFTPAFPNPGTPLPEFATAIPLDVRAFVTSSRSWGTFVPIGLEAMAVIWLLGALISISSYARSVAALRRAFDASAALPASLRPLIARLQRRCGTSATVVQSRIVTTPCAFGLIRPVVLLPADLLRAPAWQIEAVVTHELLHVRGQDTLWLLLGELVCALHWFNPLAWACVRHHRQLMELKCDARSIRAGVPVPEYVRAIASTSRQLLVRRGAAAAMAADGVVARLRRLVDGCDNKPLAASWRIGMTAVSGLFVVLLSSTSLTASAATAGEQGLALFDPAIARRVIDKGTQRLGPVEAGSARLYVLVPPGVTLRAPAAGFLCSGINCVTTVPARPELGLLAEAEDGSALRWEGCEPSPDGAACIVSLNEGNHVVALTAAVR